MGSSYRRAFGWILFLQIASLLSAAEEVLQSPVTLGYLDRRRQAQVLASKNRRVFLDFQFTNRIAESGITFDHHIVEDAGKNYQAAHYDHGNGVAAADVDNDGLPDLYFTTQLGRNELWRNLGKGRFEDITAKAGVEMVNQISVAAAFGDIDNDGLQDLYVTTVRHGNRLFHNRGGGRFEDITQRAGVGYSGHSSGIVFLDVDQDGRLDLFVSNVGIYTSSQMGPGGFHRALPDAFAGHQFRDRRESSRLFRNVGGLRFTDATEWLRAAEGAWVGDATFTDMNEDGYPDLYLVNMQGDDRFLVNLRGMGYADETAVHFPKTSWGSMGVKFFDYDVDGRPDLFVTDMHSDMTRQQTEEAGGFRPDIEKRKSEAYCGAQWTDAYLQGASNNIFGNTFYRSEGGGRFTEVSDALGVETYWPWGVSVGDLNADGFEDVVVTAGMGYPFRYAINSVLMNEGGRGFVESEFLVRVEPRANGRLGKVFFTLDCSGTDATNSLCAGKTGFVRVPGSLSSRSSVILDLDGDGDLDLVTHEFNDRPQILMSNLTERRATGFLKVQLVGTRSNRNGLGASVRVRCKDRTYHQFHDGKSGYLGQSVLPLWFGLPSESEVEGVEVRWPSGTVQRVEKPGRQQLLTITETP